jgi:hypothetical protein
MPKKRESLVDRFWNKFKRPKKGCWEWAGAKDPNGYGNIEEGHGSKSCRTVHPAHRLSWKLFNGPIPNGMRVLHKCDNPSCVRPDHLFLGTQKDNLVDCKNKGRTAKGEKNGRSKLRQKDIDKIRKLCSSGKHTQQEIASIFNINQSHVSRIISNFVWAI